MEMTQTALAVFGAGLLASLSPCVYPMIPITLGFLGMNSSAALVESRERLAATRRARWRVVAFASGQALAVFTIGLAAVALGEFVGFTAEIPAIRASVGAILVIVGMWSLVGRMPGILLSLNQRIAGRGATRRLGGPLGAMGMGAGAALVMSPCTTPVLAGVLALIASNPSRLAGASLMALYSIGFSVLVLLLGLGVVRLGGLPRSGPWLAVAHRLGAIALIAAGVWLIVGTR